MIPKLTTPKPTHAILAALLCSMFGLAFAEQAEFHVATSGDDTSPGTEAKPFRTLAHAVRQLTQADATTSTLVVHDGIHFLDQALVIDTPAQAGKTNRIVAAANARPLISAGTPLRSWTPVAGKQHFWECKLPEGQPFFRQLFDLTERDPGTAGISHELPRSRFPNEGWLRGLKGSTVTDEITRDVGRPLCSQWRRDRMDIHTTLRFKETDAAYFSGAKDWSDLQSAEMLMLASWDASWHSLRSVDLKTRDMRFFTPSRYPMDHWHYSRNKLGAPYRIENLRAAIDQPGEWSLDRGTMTVTLLLEPDQNPNDRHLVAPRSEMILAVRGTAGKRAGNLVFDGLAFAHNIYKMGVYDLHKPDWPELAGNPASFPPGYSDSQAVPRAGGAIQAIHAENLHFKNCTFGDIGAWAAHLERDVHHSVFSRCHFHHTGAGAVNIDGGAGLPEGQFPSHNRVEDCLIEHGGGIHPATVALRIANSHENIVAHNEIRHFPYSGISVGWNWSRTPNECWGNHVVYNHIHHMTDTISDGAGIYTLGTLGGMLLKGNYIHDIQRAETSVGASNVGMLFDQYSLGIHIEGNVIRRVQSYLPRYNGRNEPFRHFRNKPGHHTHGENDFEHDDSPVKLTETVERAGPR